VASPTAALFVGKVRAQRGVERAIQSESLSMVRSQRRRVRWRASWAVRIRFARVRVPAGAGVPAAAARLLLRAHKPEELLRRRHRRRRRRRVVGTTPTPTCLAAVSAELVRVSVHALVVAAQRTIVVVN